MLIENREKSRKNREKMRKIAKTAKNREIANGTRLLALRSRSQGSRSLAHRGKYRCAATKIAKNTGALRLKSQCQAGEPRRFLYAYSLALFGDFDQGDFSADGVLFALFLVVTLLSTILMLNVRRSRPVFLAIL